MEKNILSVIEADLNAQSQLREIDTIREMASLELEESKKKIKEDMWNNAMEDVSNQKKELLDKLSHLQSQQQIVLEKNKQILTNKFNQQKNNLKQKLLENIIGN